MIDIYAYYFYDPTNDNQIRTSRKLIQSVPSGSESKIRILNPNVKCDFGNAESMDFTIQNGTPYYDAFIQMRSFIQVDYDGDTIFYGRVLTISNGFFGERKIHCEGAIALLNDSFVAGTKKEARKSISILTYMSSLLENHNSQVNDARKRIYLGEVPGNYTSATSSAQRIANASREFGNDSWTNSKSALEDLKSHYGGAFRIRYVNNQCYLDWLNHYFRSTVNTQTISVGKNLIDISGSTEVSNIFTVIIPIGKSKSGSDAIYLDGYTRSGHTFNNSYLTVPEICSSLYNYGVYTDSQLNSGYHQADDYKDSLTKYGRIFKTIDFQEAHDQKTLFEKACEWIKNNYQGGVDTFSVKAIDLHLIGEDTGKILLGDRVKIKYPVGTVTEESKLITRTLTCTSVTYDLFNPENNQYTFGIPANMLGKTYGDSSDKKQKKSSSSYKPPVTTGDDEPEDTYTKWVNSVRSRLQTLLVWKKSTGGVPTGPTGSHPDGSPFYGTYLQQIVSKDENGTKWVLWEPYTPTLQKEYGPVFRSYYIWPTASNGRTLIYRGDFGSDIILSNKLITEMNRVKLFDFIWYEHGIDLRQGGGGSTGDDEIKMPSLIPNENGGTDIYGSLPGLLEGVTSKIGEIGNGSGENLLSLLAGNGDLQTVIGADGITKYLKDKPDGTKVQISIDPDTGQFVYTNPETGEPATIRDLHLEAKNSADFIGSIVTEGYAGSDGQIHIYKFGQGIENWGNGELVVAYVDGDIVRIGTRTRTRRIYLTADQVILGDDTDEQNMVQILRDAGVINGDLEPNSLVANAVYTRKISAIEGRISTLEATYITSDYLLAKHTIAAGQLSAQHFYVDTGVDSEMGSYDLKNCVSLINITRSGNTYTLHIYRSTGGEIEIPSGYNATFSRAITSWEVGWSNGTYTATAIPQDQSTSTTLQAISPVQGSEITVSGKSVTRQFEVKYGPDDEHTYTTGYKQLITINASTVYDNGRNYVNLSEPTWNAISGSVPDHRTVSVSTTGRPTTVTKSAALYLTQNSFSNHKKTVFMRMGSTSGTVYAQVDVDATSEYNSGYSSGKYNWSHNASLYCSDISYGSTGSKTVTLIVTYSASQSVPFSVGSSKRVYFD